MSTPKMHTYRVLVAVAFGLIGFGVNFIDIDFMAGSTFKITILVGLFFPLVVALAWGWRYGLLSALAGGCQTMWWLWHGDGWGVFYSVPVFTLWIVWHGWWAEHRPEGHPLYLSSFTMEIPFRIIIELGFLVVFRWLVSLNPPPWNPTVSWDHVSSTWLQTVAVKHVVEAYVLLMAAYVALSLGPVRRFFGLPPRSAQRDTSVIYASAALFGLLLWTMDALLHYLAFPREGQTFWGIAVHGASAHDVFMRSVYVMISMLAGAVLARQNQRRVGLQELLDHRNRILAAIRNVNQLIVREKNPDRLLDKVCRLLVETQGYYNAWIVLTTDGCPREPFFHAGFDGGFAPMTERLHASGDLPACAKAALSSDGVQVKIDPPAQCAGCPLTFAYVGRAGLSLRLEHEGRIFGWMSIACPATFACSTEEHDLLKEVTGDIAFALWAIETETQRETLDRKYAAVLAATHDAAVASGLDGRITVFNPGAEKLFGCTADEAVGSPITRFCPEDRLEQQAEMIRRVREKKAVTGYESERLTADGRRIPVEITLGLNTDDHGQTLGINAILRDISERKQAEEVLRKSHAMLARTESIAHVGSWEWDIEADQVRWSDELFRLLQRDPELGAPSFSEHPDIYVAEDMARLMVAVETCISTGTPYELELRAVRTDGMIRQCVARGLAEYDAVGSIHRLVGSIQDITEQKQAEAEREKLQSQLNQAQKMESVGRLAGGVAHDFNNMLGIIIGHADMILEQMEPNQPFHDDLMEIRKAGVRSAELTRQLLAFARKQTVAPKVIDLNKTVEGMLKMLHRLIGEDIDMAWIPGEKLWQVKIDPSQIDQILANLCVNARDAISGVGKITIETGNTVFGEEYCMDHAGFVPGEYAMLAVSDNGCGMDPETMSHLFEPFFTTKEFGKGTGLGLATVYGVTKQNNGFINIYSEPGLGTTFKVYLPRQLSKAGSLPDKGLDKPGERGHETVLLVEDEPTILRMASMMLEREGYAVVRAGTPGEAIRLANEHAGDIHLLMTDVVMPEMNGRDLAKNILSLYPHLKCLFMSGYTANVIAHHGVLDEGVNFIQKPFSKGDLNVKVREVLDRD